MSSVDEESSGNSKQSTLELFASGGGTTLGLRDAGFEPKRTESVDGMPEFAPPPSAPAKRDDDDTATSVSSQEDGHDVNDVVKGVSSGRFHGYGKWRVALGLVGLIALVAALVAVGRDEDEEFSLAMGSSYFSGNESSLSCRERMNILRDMLSEASGSNVMYTRKTPQHRALKWMAYKDPFTLELLEQGSEGADSPERTLFELDDSVKQELLERYVVATLYMSTGGKKRCGWYSGSSTHWTNKYDFLSSSSVCDWNDENIGNGVFCDEEGNVQRLLLGNDGRGLP